MNQCQKTVAGSRSVQIPTNSHRRPSDPSKKSDIHRPNVATARPTRPIRPPASISPHTPSVNAECHIDGRLETATAKICAWQTENRTDEEIFELLDQELDRLTTGDRRGH